MTQGEQAPVERDCEDQSFTYFKDGCYNWHWLYLRKDGRKMERPQLVKQGRWMVCPTCGGSYGESNE